MAVIADRDAVIESVVGAITDVCDFNIDAARLVAETAMAVTPP
jgi:hypothetical protein